MIRLLTTLLVCSSFGVYSCFSLKMISPLLRAPSVGVSDVLEVLEGGTQETISVARVCDLAKSLGMPVGYSPASVLKHVLKRAGGRRGWN